MLQIACGIIASSGLFYFASNRDAPAWTRPFCTYGDLFCQNPQWLLYVGAISLFQLPISEYPEVVLKVDRI